MSFSTDPYRTLGLVPGASLDDVKHAYRRLAKRYHPDSAGEREVARFLAIQAAYERIVGGRASGRPTSPWGADPGRARATRRAYRDHASRAGGASERRGSTSWAGGSWWSSGRPGDPAGSRSTGRTSGTAGASDARRASGAGPRRGPTSTSEGRASGRRKATLNSTSYDEASQQPRDPDWDGSTWYGASSGTYWTINPKEYADPRKHGPEYQARARRTRVGGPWTAEADAPAGGPGADPGPAPGSWTAGHGAQAEAATAAPRPSVGRDRAWPEEPRPSSAPATIGLLAGLVTAVPSTLVLLGSGLGSGDPLLGALLAPLVVGSAAWLVATLLGRRSASSPP